MKKFYKTYSNSIILLLSIIIGTIIGLIFKEKASILSPFGELFINLLLVIIVPLIFLTITVSIGKMNKPNRLSKILGSIILIFIITSIISVIIGIISTRINLVDKIDSSNIINSLDYSLSEEKVNISFLERTINTISTNDFINLLSKNNIIALIVFSIISGIAIILSKEKGKLFLNVLESANDVLEKIIKIIMYYAPIGIGCYFASFIGNFGYNIAVGYVKALVIYIIACLFVYFFIYTLYAFIAGGKEGVKRYLNNIISPTLTALSTCSSAASIPANTEASKKIGVSDDIANTVIPLGTSFHKDGSIIGSVFKIMFLVYLFNMDVNISKILFVSLIVTLLVTAVPIGGGTISEMLIISMMGFPVAALPILTIIATIIDAPATVLNVVGDTASSMLVARIVDGKNWKKVKY